MTGASLLEELCLKRFDLIKIDIEGVETLPLQTAANPPYSLLLLTDQYRCTDTIANCC